jgi:hypothetical protein
MNSNSSADAAAAKYNSKLHKTLVYLRQNWQLYVIFMLPALLLTLIFRYAPMGGILIAFEKYSPIKVNTPAASKSTGKKTVQPALPPAPLPSIDEAMSAYAKSFESNNGALSLDDLADLAAAKSTLDSASVQKASEKNTKKDVPTKVDLTFSNITVNPSLAKDLGFEDFNESAIGGARHGR